MIAMYPLILWFDMNSWHHRKFFNLYPTLLFHSLLVQFNELISSNMHSELCNLYKYAVIIIQYEYRLKLEICWYEIPALDEYWDNSILFIYFILYHESNVLIIMMWQYYFTLFIYWIALCEPKIDVLKEFH